MSLQYDRYCSVSLGEQAITTLDGNPDDALRVRFKLETVIAQSCNVAHVIITNLSDATAMSLLSMAQQRPKLKVSAGYRDNYGLLFNGDTYWAIKGRESPTDTTLQIFAREGGNAHDYAVVSNSLKKGSTPKDHLDVFMETLKPFGISLGYVPTDRLSSPIYPRGVAFAGMTRDYLRTLASSANCMWSIQGEQLQMVPNDGYVPGAPFVLNSATGLIGMPTQTFGGIMVRCLINPAINLGAGNLIQVDQSLIQQAAVPATNEGQVQRPLLPEIASDGIYRVCSIETTGDTRGNDWYMDLSCVSRTGVNIPTNLAYKAAAAQPVTLSNKN